MKKEDARRYRRISLKLPAQIVVNAVDEYEGELLNISPGGMALIVDAKTEPGDAVIIRIKGLDIIEGTVARNFPDGFAVSFKLPRKRRAILTEKLMIMSNGDYAEDLTDRRQSPRHRRAHAKLACRLADGTSLYAKVVDLSAEAISLDAPRRPAIGSDILVGSQRAMVIRHTPRGFVAAYRDGAAGAGNKPMLRAV